MFAIRFAASRGRMIAVQRASYQIPYSARSLSTSHASRDADLIVVGCGVAGLSASIAAAEAGASVLLLDATHGGGATAMSGGVVYAGGGTDQQKAAGYGHDTPENMYNYLLAETKNAVDEETLWDFCKGSVGRLKWMEAHGVRFEGSLCPHKTCYPTDKHYLYFSGNEKSYPFNEVAKPAPRGHRVVSPGFSGGALWKALFESAMNLGVRFRPTSKVHKVILDDRDAVCGVSLKSIEPSTKAFRRHQALASYGKRFELVLPAVADPLLNRAERLWLREAVPSTLKAPVVILAAGGFAYNPAMRQKYTPDFARVEALGTRHDDGSGILLGQAAGGSVGKMNNMSAWRFIYPPTALLEGVVVSREGRRFIAEDVYGALLSEHMILQHNSEGFLFLDSEQWARAKEQLTTQTESPLLLQRLHWLLWGHKKASSLETLASKFGVDFSTLDKTVKTYNQAISKGLEDPMKKAVDYCTPILRPPFYGIDISSRLGDGIQAVRGLTLGGLRVSGKTGLVLREDDFPITGLYAAGRSAVGVCSNGYVSGLSLADGVFSGKRAGEHAAAATSRSR